LKYITGKGEQKLSEQEITGSNNENIEAHKTPEPTAIGNEQIDILWHRIAGGTIGRKQLRQIEFAIRNVTGTTIASAVFEAIFYDKEGNVLDTVKHREIDFRPGFSRGVFISCPGQYNLLFKSYGVKIIRTTTADIEKVQLRSLKMITNDASEEEVRGIVKNISSVKTDAAVVAVFNDYQGEKVGVKVLVLKDIEPDSVRHFHISFKPQQGDAVRSCNVTIGDLAA
jgi:hypothetical protein